MGETGTEGTGLMGVSGSLVEALAAPALQEPLHEYSQSQPGNSLLTPFPTYAKPQSQWSWIWSWAWVSRARHSSGYPEHL